MKRNRRIRNRIAAVSPETVTEIEHWNDGASESLAEYGVPVSDREERLQAQTLELMVMEEIVEAL